MPNETFVFYPSLLDAENDTNAFTAAEALVFENRTVTTDMFGPEPFLQRTVTELQK